MNFKASPILAIHAAGAAALLACLGVGAWYGFLNPDRAADRIALASQELSASEVHNADLSTELVRQTDLYQKRSAEFGERDLLPEKIPVEKDLRTISDIAGRNGLELVSFTPITARTYPGVAELRYEMVTNGEFLSYVGFLAEFQQCDSWADIIAFELKGQFGPNQQGQNGKFTISLYSAESKRNAADAEPEA
jgi:hypothetical protein